MKQRDHAVTKSVDVSFAVVDGRRQALETELSDHGTSLRPID